MRTAGQKTGDAGEEQAFQFLQSQGLSLLARNVGSKLGELDLIMLDGKSIVFVEVRVRRSAAFGGAAASVTPAKQQKLRRQAQAWLKQRYGDGRWPACRFDVCAIEAGVMNWIRDAF